ncbi:MAG TPA: metalloregulator ArsR/SmtB family transcription factor [Spirochaetia bacterium]|nr:metalloregulator ArsR/SmtB family transcription factor [Spirochaetia bacterium]
MSNRFHSYEAANADRGPGSAVLAGDASSDAEMARLAKALGHRSRVRILRCLAADRSCTCGDLVTQIAQAQSTVSQHLKVLKDAGLIQVKMDPPHTCHCGLNAAVLQRFKHLVADL